MSILNRLLLVAYGCLYIGFAANLQSAEASLKQNLKALEAALSEPVLSDLMLDEIDRLNLDDPRLFTSELAQLWIHNKSSGNRLVLARTGWLLARFASDRQLEQMGLDLLAVIDESMTLIEKEKLPVPVAELRFCRLNVAKGRSGEELPIYADDLLRLAYQVKNKRVRARFIAFVADHIVDRGQTSSKIPAYLNEVREILGTDYSASDVATLTSLGRALSQIGQELEAQAIDQALDKLCTSLQMRSYCSLRAYQTGLMLIKHEEKKSAEQAKIYFFKALELAQQINDADYTAISYYGLNLAFNKTQDFEDAIMYGNLAYASYQKLEQKVWMASTLKNLASSYLGLKIPQLALEKAQEALRICPPEFSIDLIKIYDKLAEIHEVLGNYPEAFHYSKLSQKKNEQVKAEDAERKYMELRNEALSKQNQMQKEQIELLTRFKTLSLLALGLSLVLCLALAVVWRQASIIRLSRQRMKDVLDHIDEGIIVLDRSLKIKIGYSSYVDTFFKSAAEALVQRDFLELLRLYDNRSGVDMDAIRDILQMCIGEQMLSWELNRANLPNEIQLDDRHISLHWQPLFNADHLISSYLISIRDITELRAVQRQAAQDSERVTVLHQLLQEILAGQIGMIRRFTTEMRQEWSVVRDQAADGTRKHLAMQRLHTWKGNARTLGLRKLAETLHQLESQVLAEAAEKNWTSLDLRLQDYEYLLQAMISEGNDRAASNLYDFVGIYAQEMQKRLEEAGLPYQGVLVLDRVLRWRREVLTSIHNMLLHAISNAIDHGFIRPRNRRKAAPAQIQIEARPGQGTIELEVIDNGFGVDWELLKDKAQQRGVTSKSRKELVQMLFEDGFSSAAELSETSGRGVGLCAIHSICQELGGSISLTDTAGGGTTLHMEFPSEVLAPAKAS